MGIWSIKSLRASCYAHVWDYFLMPYKFHIILSNYRQVTKAIKAANIRCKKGRVLAPVYFIIYFVRFEHGYVYVCETECVRVCVEELKYKIILDWWDTEYVVCVHFVAFHMCVFAAYDSSKTLEIYMFQCRLQWLLFILIFSYSLYNTNAVHRCLQSRDIAILLWWLYTYFIKWHKL